MSLRSSMTGWCPFDAGRHRTLRCIGVGPLVAEQFGRREGRQGGEMLVPVGNEERPHEPARQPVRALADRGDVTGQLAVAQRRREVEAMNLVEGWTGPRGLLQELEALAEIGRVLEFGIGHVSGCRKAVTPEPDMRRDGRKLRPRGEI